MIADIERQRNNAAAEKYLSVIILLEACFPQALCALE